MCGLPLQSYRRFMTSGIAASTAMAVRHRTLVPMRTSRFPGGVLAAVLSVAMVATSPAHGAAPDGADPLATTVTGACAGGPGRLSLTVHPPADGRYRVQVIARGLVEGSRWDVEVVHEDEQTGRRDETFRRVAVDGGWTVVTPFRTEEGTASGDMSFYVNAQEKRGGRNNHCFVLNSPSPAVGLSDCNKLNGFIVLLARELDDGSTLVRSFVTARADSPWHLRLTATGAGSRQVVEFNDRAGKYGLGSRVVLTGVTDPRLRLLATNKDRGRCFIGVDPPSATTAAPPNSNGLAGLGRR